MIKEQENRNILAIESSGNVASVAVLSQGTVLTEFSINNKKTHSTTLVPMMDQMIKLCGFELKDFDAIAVTRGPGSFTGLRIGAATVKGLGLALDLPVIPVSTLECLAMNVTESEKLICPIMDARRSQVYTAVYESREGTLQEILKEAPMDIKDLMEELIKLKKEVLFLGDGVPVYQNTILETMKEQAFFVKKHNNLQRASSLAVIAESKWEERVSAKEFALNYLRASQAEREWKEEHQGEELPCLS